MLHVALFEDQRGVRFHPLTALDSFSVVLSVKFDLFDRHQFLPFKLKVEGDRLSCLFSDDVVKLACEIFAWEREILGQDNLTENVLAVGQLLALLVVVGELAEDFLGFLGDELVHEGNQFEKLGRHLVDFHSNGVR